MDGCKKVFAREADLKRHQRTTKTHSIPGFQCPQCDATFTRTDALRRHQKSRHNGVVIEPTEEQARHSGDGASDGSRSPSPGGTPSRSAGEGSMNGSPPAAQSSTAGSSAGPSSYYRPHTMQDGGGYYAGYPPPPRPPPPGMILNPHYPPPPISLPTSATRSHQANWQPPPAATPWGPEGHPMVPPPGMYMPSFYPSPYYRHPGMPMPFPPQINPELLSQSNGVAPPESDLRSSSPHKPAPGPSGQDKREEEEEEEEDADGDADADADADAEMDGSSQGGDSQSLSVRGTQAQAQQPSHAHKGAGAGPDASTLMAAAALQAVLAFQKDQEEREAASRRASTASDVPMQPPFPQQDPQPAQVAGTTNGGGVPTNGASSSEMKLEAPNGEIPPDQNGGTSMATNGEVHVSVQPSEVDIAVKQADASVGAAPQPMMEQLLTEDGTPMLNPAELLTQESLASPPPS
ncbi:hypothetical protein BD413DRAFT_124353 [Trametes elegans]|nr:hypothetical protein BD413DRAFT_124353 [Trametes elegans]